MALRCCMASIESRFHGSAFISICTIHTSQCILHYSATLHVLGSLASKALSTVQTGQQLHLNSLIKRNPGELATGDHIRGAVIIDKTATLGEGCLIGPDVSIGPGCNIGNGVRLCNCVIMKGCTVRVPEAWP
jgi:UDP-3-O-[3-hydroxymyristoyl] glucosamine N-acyltransferase